MIPPSADNPNGLTSILFSFVLLQFAGIELLFTHLRFLRQRSLQILILLVVSLVCLRPSNGRYFMGFEYEDAYIYTANSRYLLFNQDFSVHRLLYSQIARLSPIYCLLYQLCCVSHFSACPLLPLPPPHWRRGVLIGRGARIRGLPG